MKKITVVIPNFNGIQYVERCLDSLKRQTFSEFDVIFVDNGSVDGSRELTEEKYPWVRVIALAENTGFCKAVNIGIEATQTPYVVLLNNDTEAEPDFLLELYRGIERKKNAKVFTEKERISRARTWFWKKKEIKKTENESSCRPIPWSVNHE